MKERPILMNTEMVRATLEGRKTQTRRVIKPQPGPVRVALMKTSQAIEAWVGWNGKTATSIVKCPYGKVGDRLWVRESYYQEGRYGTNGHGKFDPIKESRLYEGDKYRGVVIFKGLVLHGFKKIPLIHMPRWASRINLEIIDIRLERVKDVTFYDAKAEGWPDAHKYSRFTCGDKPIRWFESLWESINAKRGYSWITNPWVWVIEFKLIDNKESKQ